jgi:hypothetical protein
MQKRAAGILLILVASIHLPGCASGGGPEASKNGSNANETSERAIGSDARLYLEGRNSIMVAVDEKAFSDLINALSSGGEGVDGLIQSQKVFTVPNNTRVRILEIATSKNKVRITEGDRIMQEGWVHELWIR